MKKRHTSLTKEAIVAGAIDLADQVGIDSVTMRKLAEALGTAPMTIYYHVPSKDELIDAIVDQVFSEINIPPVDADWKTAIRERCRSARAVLNRHWWAAPLMESRTSPGPANLRHHDAVIGCFRRAGFSVEFTAHAYAVLDSYVYGFAFEEAMLPGANREEFEPIVEEMAEQLESGGYTYLAELAREHVLQPGYEFGASFEFGLDLLLDGLDPDGDETRSETATARGGPR